ncbi:ATP-binding protein [Falsirhodobacter algicola]|uniref:histidine kinase n=1 Tax=Falsirhodobacter algicola TaxID=2692330 RepID=A0A8J8MTK7_9RHOB|nr:ATP-binding protein [Falsirhodobacter algicola]QUS36214.1 histidine kinase [Falsirhodobacter algicola]
MISLRLRMFVILLAATCAVWASAFAWIHHSTAAKVDRVLDARLAEAARMVSSLMSDRRIDVDAAIALAAPAPAGEDYFRQLSCQVWRLDGARVAGSTFAPEAKLAQQDGFGTNTVDGIAWRVFAVTNVERGVRVMIGDSLAMRERLIGDVTRGLILPSLAVLPVLAGLIWWGLSGGLRPLRRLAGDLSVRDAEELRPLDRRLPTELAPIQSAMNDLFARVEAARERERSFTAFAAHELKTPLAGLKTQAQIAARGDAGQRARALTQIEASVARTDRLVRQLLDMAAVDARPGGEDRVPISVILRDCVQMTEALARGRDVTVRVRIDGDMPQDRLLLGAALRNVLENAIHASPAGGVVQIRAGAGRIEVTDAGPGIPAEDRARITERFFRGRRPTYGGSGLGLAIARAAMVKLGGDIDLHPAEGGGEVAVLRLS